MKPHFSTLEPTIEQSLETRFTLEVLYSGLPVGNVNKRFVYLFCIGVREGRAGGVQPTIFLGISQKVSCHSGNDVTTVW